ncbi:hypothetical protein Tco_1200749 [Tanacetum coccineum]
MATTKNLDPPGAVDRGPTISIPHCEKGQAGIIDVISCFSFLGRDDSTLRLRGGAFYEAFARAFDGAFEGPLRRRSRVFEEKAGGFDRAFYGAFYRAFEEKAGGLLRTQQRLYSVSVVGVMVLVGSFAGCLVK